MIFKKEMGKILWIDVLEYIMLHYKSDRATVVIKTLAELIRKFLVSP